MNKKNKNTNAPKHFDAIIDLTACNREADMILAIEKFKKDNAIVNESAKEIVDEMKSELADVKPAKLAWHKRCINFIAKAFRLKR